MKSILYHSQYSKRTYLKWKIYDNYIWALFLRSISKMRSYFATNVRSISLPRCWESRDRLCDQKENNITVTKDFPCAFFPTFPTIRKSLVTGLLVVVLLFKAFSQASLHFHLQTCSTLSLFNTILFNSCMFIPPWNWNWHLNNNNNSLFL